MIPPTPEDVRRYWFQPCRHRELEDRCELCKARARGESASPHPWTGSLPAGGPSELLELGLLGEEPAGYWERWSAESVERVRTWWTAERKARHPVTEDAPEPEDPPHEGWRTILKGVPAGELGDCEACGKPWSRPADGVGFLCLPHYWDRRMDRPYRNITETGIDEITWSFNVGPHATWTPCDSGCKLAAAPFSGGPLDGQRRRVPEHGPAIVTFREHFYAVRKGRKRTYDWVSP